MAEAAIGDDGRNPAVPDAPRAAPEMYPAILKLAGRPCLVVGGGVVASRKAADLLRCGARVHVVAPEWRAGFESLLEAGAAGRLTRSTRPFRASDLEGVTLVVAATDDRAVQEEVAAAAGSRGILCNVVDVNELCSFYVPATLRRGSLTVSVGTEGKSPLFAVALRDRLASIVGPRTADGLERLARGREMARASCHGNTARRREALRRLVTTDVVDDLLAEKMEAFEKHLEEWLRWLASQAD